MSISLIRMRTMATRVPGLVRGLAAWTAFSFMLALTPCCDVYAGTPAAPEHAASRHAPDSDHGLTAHETDGHRDICGKWFDNASFSGFTHDGALAPSWDGKAAVPPAPGHYAFASHDPGAVSWRPLHPLSPPYVLYLRFARLLL